MGSMSLDPEDREHLCRIAEHLLSIGEHLARAEEDPSDGPFRDVVLETSHIRSYVRDLTPEAIDRCPSLAEPAALDELVTHWERVLGEVQDALQDEEAGPEETSL